MYNRTKSLYLVSLMTLLPAFAQAQTCTPAPSCAELGFAKTAANCSGKSMIKCPFDQSKVFCEDGASCASLGFTDTVSECPGTYSVCPNDSLKGKCDFEATAGDLKYSLRTSDHNGWLLCNGRSYSTSQYPELYSAISSSFGSYLPNYSGYFLKGAATSSGSTLKTAVQAGLPNITGTIGFSAPNFYQNTASGAFYTAGSGGGSAGTGSYGLGFDASKSNSIYGRSSTVTPQNYSANVFIYTGRKK